MIFWKAYVHDGFMFECLYLLFKFYSKALSLLVFICHNDNTLADMMHFIS